VIIPIF